MWMCKFTETMYAVLKFYIINVLWIFFFVIFCVTAFLMVMHGSQKDELRKYVLPNQIWTPDVIPPEKTESVDRQLKALTERLTEKEHALQRSQCEIKNAETVLNELENKTANCRGRYRNLMIELKKDLHKTEEEVRILQNQVSNLSLRRQALRSEVIKQQEDYQKMLNNFTKEIENKKMVHSPYFQKSRTHSRISCFGLQ